MQFTQQQLADYRAYEKVRQRGKYNMFDPRARKATRLSSEQYLFVMRNFTELKEAAESATPLPEESNKGA